MTRVAVIDSGVANLASVVSALNTVGASPFVTADPEAVRSAAHVVLPGVGHFGAAMDTLGSSGLAEAVREVSRQDRPLLAVCLGLQLLSDGSDESPGTTGLGIFPGRCRRLPADVRVPHLGWNGV